ncbi:MAG: SpoIID/LytB domain-containing protein [Clostridia bacterium]|nr:SpoIID/LytB domain-containing protein [Clostridia bacterium]
MRTNYTDNMTDYIIKTKKFLTELLCMAVLAFAFLLCTASVANADSEAFVNVGLKYGSNSILSCSLRSDDGFVYGRMTDSGIEEASRFSQYSELNISLGSGIISVMAPDGTSFEFGEGYCLAPAGYDTDALIYIDSVPYRGGVTFLKNSSGGLNIINHVSLDDYVRGVLGAELGGSAPLEALKAQAVAARSYAVCNKGKHSSQGFDVCNSTHCQVYKGFTAESKNTNTASEETAGEVLYYDGSPVEGLYSKNCGGYTQNVEDVWGTKLGYLRAVKDEYSPEYSWNVSYTFSQLESMLESAGKSVGTLSSVSIDGRYDNGYVSELTFRGSSGSTTFKGEKIKSFFGTSVVKSNLFSFSYITQDSIGISGSLSANSAGAPASGSSNSNTAAAGGGTSEIAEVYISDGNSLKTAGSSLYVIAGDGSKTKIKTKEIVASNGTSKAVLSDSGDSADKDSGKDSPKPAASLPEAETVTGGNVTVYGLGYGHGVGMPQDSAINMAKLGFDYRTILKYYYTDVQIKQYN